MDQTTLATREIMWNIPASFKYVMYSALLVSFIIFIKGFYDKYVFVTGKKPILKNNELFPKNLNWKSFFQIIFLQGKVTRKSDIGIIHSFIFYGFVILWIATDIVAIHYDTPFKVFQGTTYIVVSFLADFAGIFILLGLALAAHRRYITKPDYLSATYPNREKYMYLMLILLVVIGYFIEGIRILGNDMPIGEKTWAPFGWAMANFLGLFNLSDASLSTLYRVSWMFHMLNTMVFVASIPFSKFSHIFLLPFGALITPKFRGGILNPMDFENEDAETFGLGNINELTMKNKLDMISCVECGRCTQVCPANQAGKILDPKLIVTKLRDRALPTNIDYLSDQINMPEVGLPLWDENAIFQNNEVDACTTCGACMEECPANIEHVPIIMELKRYKVLTNGEIPPAAGDAVSKIRNNGNPWGISQDDRFSWADGLDVPVAQEGEHIDYLYYVGCAGSYDANNQKVTKDVITLLRKAGVKFAVMGKTEKCNGDPIRRFGDEYSFFEVAIENIANMNKYKFDKVVTHCPHCLHTIGKEYAKFEDGEFETIHHTELLYELIKSKKLNPSKEVKEELTYHDPCYLGRHHGQYDAPREILKSIPGVSLTEMKESKDKSLCCGMGGGNMWYELPEGEHLANNRLNHIAETKAPKLAAACSFCLINFHSAKGHNKETEELEIDDVASILVKSVE
jgi:Fe-S oxidoreductase/nitrate reductase gamma subunit